MYVRKTRSFMQKNYQFSKIIKINTLNSMPFALCAMPSALWSCTMSDTVIKVENLSKKYTIRHQQERYTALRDVMAQRAKRLGAKLLSLFTLHPLRPQLRALTLPWKISGR